MTLQQGANPTVQLRFENYSGNIVFASDGHGGTLIYDPPSEPADISEPANIDAGISTKDVIFAKANMDLLTGGPGADQFVFRTSDGNHTITDFTPGQNHLDLRAFSAIDTSNIEQWFLSHAAASPANPADVLITLDTDKNITLQHLAFGTLHAGDFIVSPHA